MKVKFLRNVSAAGVHHEAGSESELPEGQAKTLIAMKKAARCVEPQSKAAEPAPQPAIDEPKPEARKGNLFKNKEK